MLLKLMRARIRIAREQEGFALPSVIAIFAIVAIVSLTLAGMAVHAVGFSTATRATTQSRSAADSGINIALTQMGQSDATLGLDERFPCSLTPASTLIEQFTVQVHYFDAAGSELLCSGANLTVSMLDKPVKAIIDSTGVATSKGVAGQSAGDRRTVTAVVKIDIETTPGEPYGLTKSIFSDGPLGISNATHITDSLGQTSADVYSNGDVVCDTSQNFEIEGSIYAQGNVTLDNPCVVQGDVWAAGHYSAPGNVTIGRNLLLGSGGSAPYESSDLDTTWVQGSVVSNGSVTLSGAGNQSSCALIGAKANVCGSVTSVAGQVTIASKGAVGGDAQAYGSVSIDAGNKPSVYGNVRSVTGDLTQGSSSNKSVVGGYVAVRGVIGLDDSGNIGNKSSTCGTSAAYGSVSPCPAGTPQLSVAAIPTELDFPTNTTVVAPPRESLPTVTSNLAPWLLAGWTQAPPADVPTCDLPDSVYDGTFSGKLLVVVQGCGTNPLVISRAIQLSGDLVILSPTGFHFTSGNGAVTSTGGTHELQALVPSDSGNQTGGDLVTWSQPLASDPDYYQPTCTPTRTADFGDIDLGNNFSPDSDVDMFLYTPCNFSAANHVGTINGEVYSGTSDSGNSESVNYVPMTVPGAMKDPTQTTAPQIHTTVTETSRFDARN